MKTVEPNSQMQEVLNKFKALHPLPIESLEPEQARQQPELRDAVMGVLQDHAMKRLIPGIIENVHQIEHKLIPGCETDLLIRIYRPSEDTGLPVVLYFHGGGWVLGSLNSYDSSCRALTNAAGCIVISVAYRQAPEHVYPAAHEDAYAAYDWLLENATAIGGDVNRIAIAGESAGANLAACVSLRAKKMGLPLPVHQLLIYPVTDSDMETESYLTYANAKPLNREMMKWFFDYYFGATTQDMDAFPLQNPDLAGLPPTTILTAEIDPLCSEAEAYAERLESAGVLIYARRYPNVSHEFFGMGAVLSEAREAVADASRNLKNAFHQIQDGKILREDVYTGIQNPIL